MAASRILVVTDYPPISLAVEHALRPANVIVPPASGATAALRILADQSADIMIVDVDTPTDGRMSGTELMRLVRERKPDVDIIAIAEALSATMTADVICAGAADCLEKAELADQVGEVIDSITERRHHRHERVPWPDGKLKDSAIIGRDSNFRRVYKQVARLARSHYPVLIIGERGTGKMAIAREIHRLSRGSEPFVVLESTSIAEGIAESELFGHVQGAFTDAKHDHKGCFERAGRGTVVIDEVADLPRGIQGKLLRVLQERELIPVGGTTTIVVHARVIASTNRPLRDAVESGEFRPDVYDRLLIGLIEVPPLRERRGDIPELARHFIAKAAKELKLPAPPFIVPEALDALAEYDWPGNVRELEHTMAQAVLETIPYVARTILVSDLKLDQRRKRASASRSGRSGYTGPARPAAASILTGSPGREPLDQSVVRDRPSSYEGLTARQPRARKEVNRPRYQQPGDRDLEKANIRRALEQTDGNRRAAARIMNMARSSLYEKIDKYGLGDIGCK